LLKDYCVHEAPQFVFQCGHVFSKSRLLCFVTNHEQSTSRGIPNATYYVLRDGKEWVFTLAKWAAVALAAVKEPVPMIAMLGRIGNAQGHREELVDFGVGATVPSAHVHAGDEILLSVAGKEVFQTMDAATWTPLPI
jgi:hypothetical protein